MSASAGIAPDTFLTDMVLGRQKGYFMAGRLARMQIVTYNRRGHILQLNTEGLRKDIVKGCQWNMLPHLVVDCRRCWCQAFLYDWLKASEMSVALEKRVLRDLAVDNKAFRLEFMMRCTGAAHATGILHLIDAQLLDGYR